MGKQDNIVQDNKQQIDVWIAENRPITWITKTLKVSVDKFKKYYSTYKPSEKKSNTVIEKNIEYAKDPKKCLCCNRDLSFVNRKRKFCSHSCSATFNNCNGVVKTNSTDYYFNPKTCTTCNKIIPYNLRHKNICNIKCKVIKHSNCKICGVKIRVDRKTCSKRCLNLHFINNAKKNALGSLTGVNKYKYNNIWMDSKWEVKIAQFLDANNIKWVRSKNLEFLYVINSSEHRYYPDFYLPEYDLYLDPKNSFKMKLDYDKIQNVILRYNIKLWVGDVYTIIDDLSNLILGNKTV